MAEQIVNQPSLYVNGLVISNDATTPNTKIDVSAGICRDSTNVFDINLGNYLGVNPNISANTSTVINAAASGLNGLDTGTFAASKVYNVFVIADATGFNVPGCILSLSSVPTMPFGYGIYRKIGVMISDASVHFLKGYWFGINSERKWVYDAYQATSVTAGTSATYAAINLSTLVPSVNNTPVIFEINWTANAAADTFNMQGGNATGDEWTVIAPVAGATAHTVALGTVLAQSVASVPTSNYKVSAVGGVAINVAGFQMSL